MKLKKTIKNITLYSEGKGGKGKGIKMSSNEMPFPVDASSKKVLVESIKNINRYPQKEPKELKMLIAKKYGLSDENIVLGNGSDEIMQFIFMAFVERSQNIIIPEKTFLMYRIYADIFGVKKILSRMKDYAIDLGDMLGKINKKTKAVFIANPNNPTGMLLSKQDIIKFIKKVPKDIMIVIDAAYMDFCDNNYEKDFQSIIKQGKKNIVFLRTFSKSFGMASLRLGYSVADRETSLSLNAMRQPFNINSMALKLAEKMLNNNRLVKSRIMTIRRLRKDMERFLKRNNIAYLPSQANFLCFECKKSQQLFDFCRKKGIFIRHLQAFGMPNHIRVTVSYKKHNLAFQKLLMEFKNTKKAG